MEKQKILDGMLTMKGLTLDEMNFASEEFGLTEDPDIQALMASLLKSKHTAMQSAGLVKLTEKE
jgi:hypothetical protein